MLNFKKYTEKVNLVNEAFLQKDSMNLFATIGKYLTRKLDYQVTPMDYFEKIVQDDVELKCITFITSMKLRFRINFYSKSNLLNIDSYDFYSVDFWEIEQEFPSTTMYIKKISNFNTISLVSLIYSYIASRDGKTSLEDNLVDALITIEETKYNNSTLNESLLEDAELAEFLLMRSKYRGAKRSGMTIEQKRRFYYLALKHHFNETDVDNIIRVENNAVGVELDLGDEEILKDESIVELEKKLSQKIDIKTAFKHLELLIGSIARRITYSLIITGSAGVGKTETVLDTMQLLNLKIDQDFTLIKGSVTAKGLYNTFYRWRDDKILVFDDCDAVFRKGDGINILKGALDTSRIRTISWKSNATFDATGKTEEEIEELVDRGKFPDKIDITSSAIFITNLTKEDILKNKELAAVMSRSQFIEMVFTEEDIISRITEILPNMQIMDMSNIEKSEVLDTLIKVVKAGKIQKELNLRTFISMCKAKYNIDLHIATCEMEGRDPGFNEDDWIYIASKYS